ncbi:MAG: TonB-dependent receptor [Chitinophagales bacterium]|nr:TonB-dependent receptor [Chitinophagales bacterium]
MNVRFGFLLFFVLCSNLALKAQKIHGIATSNDNKPIPSATVGLLKAKDSSVVKWATTKTDGSYEFAQIPAGQYLIAISHVNHSKSFSAIVEHAGNADYAVPPILMSPLQKKLAGVTVTSKRPILEVKADKTIFNVEGTVNAMGTDALELLKRSPGVQADKDDNLSMSGKNGVQVYIDGRPTPLGGKDLADYLKSIPSAQIEAIEIISNPSARYDAAGNAGIINIRLKKNKSLGTNGSINSGYAIGIYPKYNGGLFLNHRNKKVNLFGSYNTNIAKQEFTIDFDRTILDTFFQNRTLMIIDPVFHSYKTGADYFVSKKSTIGVLINGVVANGEVNSVSTTPVIYKPSSTISKILKAGTNTDFTRNNINTNINYRYADSTGRELNLDGDYGHFKIRTSQYQPNIYYDPTGTVETSRIIYRMIAPNDIYIGTLKADYTMPFQKGQLSFGGKIAVINSKNDFRRLDVFPTYEKQDTLRSNNFNYKENINALYINFNKSFKKVVIQFGVRMENTNTEGRSKGYKLNATGNYVTYDSSFERRYTNLFPSAAITFNGKPQSQWSISYSRRIDRPTYQSLNPFEFRLDEYSFSKGNTGLRPQYTNSVAITHIYKFKLTSKLSYSHTKDIFTQFFDTTERSKVFITQRNLAKQNTVGFDITYPLQLKWYSGFINLNSYYSHYEADLGPGRVVDLDIYALSLVMQHSFSLGKGYRTEFTANYSSPSISQGTLKTKSLWGLDAGMQKSILKNKGTVRIAVSDIFQTRWPKSVSDFAGQELYSRNRLESRQFRINFSYRFGSNQVKGARQRRTGAEDELNRVQPN